MNFDNYPLVVDGESKMSEEFDIIDEKQNKITRRNILKASLFSVLIPKFVAATPIKQSTELTPFGNKVLIPEPTGVKYVKVGVWNPKEHPEHATIMWSDIGPLGDDCGTPPEQQNKVVVSAFCYVTWTAQTVPKFCHLELLKDSIVNFENG